MTTVRRARGATRHVVRSVLALAVLILLTSCGARPLEDSGASPDEVIAAWSRAACGGAPVEKWTGEGDEVARARCYLPINGTLGEKEVWLGVYKSKSALKTKLATAKCGTGYLKVIGPKWYSMTAVQEAATALQDAGGKLLC